MPEYNGETSEPNRRINKYMTMAESGKPRKRKTIWGPWTECNESECCFRRDALEGLSKRLLLDECPESIEEKHHANSKKCAKQRAQPMKGQEKKSV